MTDLEKYKNLLIETKVQYIENDFDKGKIIIIPSDIYEDDKNIKYINYGSVGLDIKLLFDDNEKIIKLGAWL